MGFENGSVTHKMFEVWAVGKLGKTGNTGKTFKLSSPFSMNFLTRPFGRDPNNYLASLFSDL
jgi:hypothetical protein